MLFLFLQSSQQLPRRCLNKHNTAYTHSAKNNFFLSFQRHLDQIWSPLLKLSYDRKARKLVYKEKKKENIR